MPSLGDVYETCSLKSRRKGDCARIARIERISEKNSRIAIAHVLMFYDVLV